MAEKRPKLCNFVKKELEFFIENCNFTDEELQFFNLRAKNKSMIEICDIMHIKESKATTLSNKVNKKIIKVL